MYHVFAPTNSTAFVPTIKFPQAAEPRRDFEFCNNKLFPEQDTKEIRFNRDPCPESVITILPPAEISKKMSEKVCEKRVESQLNLPSTSLNNVGSFPQLPDSTLPLYVSLTPGSPSKSSSVTLKPPSIPDFTFSQPSYANNEGSKTETVQPTTNPSTAGEKESVKEKNEEGDVADSKDSKAVLGSTVPYPETMVGDSNVMSMGEPEVSAPDPTTPSAAIPVPAMSQAHATPSVDLELGRRTMMHELEPIIEHRDEGTSSIGSSTQDLHSEHSLSPESKKTVEVDNRKKS